MKVISEQKLIILISFVLALIFTIPIYESTKINEKGIFIINAEIFVAILIIMSVMSFISILSELTLKIFAYVWIFWIFFLFILMILANIKYYAV